ncbi:retrovirus-related pol polyprotein from transposon TNT 1-94 [Tanacetum coccineum]
MLTMEKNVIVARADNRPPMVDKIQYSSWQTCMPTSKVKNMERESKLYDEFDTFTSEKGETIHSYYLRFAQLINDMRTIGMSIQPLQLRTSSNPRNQATIQDDRVTVQTVQGRQTQGYASIGARSNATGIGVNRNRGTNTACQAKVIRCYNCQEEGHMARQCTKPKRPRNSAWFKEKMLLAEALESGDVLDEEHMAFFEDNGNTVTTGQESQEIPTLAIF